VRTIPTRPTRAPGGREAGVALVWALFGTLVIAGVVLAGTTTKRSIDQLASADFVSQGQAESVAQAGLVDAYAWFRRQTVQPVVTFAPRRDLAAVPPVNETDDPTIGLVREYEVMPSLWARYEVRPGVPEETYTDNNPSNGRYDVGEPFTDTNGNGVRDPERETVDVAIKRGLAGAGGAWRVVSHGFIFRRPRADLPLGVDPNVRVAAAHTAGEIRRLTITPPATAALCMRTGSAATIGVRSRILGGSKGGIISRPSTGSPSIAAGAEVTGTPAVGTVVSYVDAIDNVFGVTITELKGMADASYGTAAAVPASIGEYTLNVVNSAITFDATRPLRGTGVVVVLGDCTLSAGSNSFFNGLLYVQGNLTMRAPAFVRGTVVVTGTANISGTGGDYVEIDYDAGILVNLLTLMGQYRHTMAVYPARPLLPDGTPDEVGGNTGTGGMGMGGGLLGGLLGL
jgi:hypothetical protein